MQSKGLSRVFSNTTAVKPQLYVKNIALTRWTFVGKIMSLLFNMLFRLSSSSSRLVITFLPSSMHLLISWLQSPSAVIFEPPKIKSATLSTVSASISHEVMGPVRQDTSDIKTKDISATI